MKFKAKVWKSGSSYVMTVPSDYIKYGQVDKEKEYDIEMKEAKK